MSPVKIFSGGAEAHFDKEWQRYKASPKALNPHGDAPSAA